MTAMKEQRPFTGIGRSSSIRYPCSICCFLRSSNRLALVVTRILMTILISDRLVVRLKSGRGIAGKNESLIQFVSKMGGEPARNSGGSSPETCSCAYITGSVLRNRHQYFGSTGKACTAAIDEILTKAP
jgi:hypothetical protein